MYKIDTQFNGKRLVVNYDIVDHKVEIHTVNGMPLGNGVLIQPDTRKFIQQTALKNYMRNR